MMVMTPYDRDHYQVYHDGRLAIIAPLYACIDWMLRDVHCRSIANPRLTVIEGGAE